MTKVWAIELVEKPKVGPVTRSLYYAAFPNLDDAKRAVMDRAASMDFAQTILKGFLTDKAARELIDEHGLKFGDILQWHPETAEKGKERP